MKILIWKKLGLYPGQNGIDNSLEKRVRGQVKVERRPLPTPFQNYNLIH
jgi:hypothetical protein